MHHTTMTTREHRNDYESELIALHGPRPINPFYRLRHQSNLTLKELSALMHCSEQGLIRLEQGCFESPLPVALEWWVNRSQLSYEQFISEGQIVSDYEEYQAQIRRRHRHFFGEALYVRTGLNDVHPLTQLRSCCYDGTGASVTEVAKALCLNQATLQHWSKKWRTQKTVPKAFTAVCIALGYPRDSVSDFCVAYDLWRTNNK